MDEYRGLRNGPLRRYRYALMSCFHHLPQSDFKFTFDKFLSASSSASNNALTFPISDASDSSSSQLREQVIQCRNRPILDVLRSMVH